MTALQWHLPLTDVTISTYRVNVTLVPADEASVVLDG